MADRKGKATHGPGSIPGPVPAKEAESIETLRNRYEDLKEAKTRAETRLETARVGLDELKRKARTEYGTDDLEKLKRMLEELKDENKRRRSEYQTQLERIESDLREVNERYDQALKDEESRR